MQDAFSCTFTSWTRDAAFLFTSMGNLCMFFKHHQLPFTKQLAHNCAYFQIKSQNLVPVPVRFDWTRSHRRTLRNGDRDVKAFPMATPTPCSYQQGGNGSINQIASK